MSFAAYKDLYNQNGFVVIKSFFNNKDFSTLKSAADLMEKAEEKSGHIMKYFEKRSSDQTVILNRVEYFTDFFHEISAILEGDKIKNLLYDLTSERFILFKEKINFKLSGAGGFKPHQDSAAFVKFIQDEMHTIMLPLDKSNVNNGCLRVASSFHHNVVLKHENGEIMPEFLHDVEWLDIILEPSDIVIFSSYLAHTSSANLSPDPRRSYFITYSKEVHGSKRAEYYRYKRKMFPPRVERKEEEHYVGWKKNLAREII